MKTPYQEMREKASDLIEKQRKAADLRAELYRQKIEEEAKEKQRKKNLEGIPSQALSRANRRPAQSNSDATLDVVVLDMLSEAVEVPSISLATHYSHSRSTFDNIDPSVRPVETLQTPSQSSYSNDNSYSSSSSSSDSSSSSSSDSSSSSSSSDSSW